MSYLLLFLYAFHSIFTAVIPQLTYTPKLDNIKLNSEYLINFNTRSSQHVDVTVPMNASDTYQESISAPSQVVKGTFQQSTPAPSQVVEGTFQQSTPAPSQVVEGTFQQSTPAPSQDAVQDIDQADLTASSADNQPSEPLAIPADQVVENYLEYIRKLGYYRGETYDSDLDARNAVVRFQADHNLSVDGEFEGQTPVALVKRLSASKFIYNDTLPALNISEHLITINKSKRILTLYHNGKVRKKYPVAVGNPPDLTPSGKFTISNKLVNPYWGGGGYAQPVEGGSPYNPLGHRWMGISYEGGYSYGVHGNSSPYSIGLNVSHGCVRMINYDAEELFELITIGINVWIGYDEELNEWGVYQPEY